MRGSRHGWGALVAACLALAPRVAAADWPVARHDARRTGAATGTSDLRAPEVFWRVFLGGQVAAAHAAPTFVDGERALAVVAGGRVSMERLDGATLWRSDNLRLSQLEAIVDLDGDGAREVVARSTARVFVLDAATGALRWAQDEGEMGTIGGVRVADLDGDALPDVTVQECMCCQVRSGETGFVYGFAAGAASPTRLWRLPDAHCAGSRSMIVDDLDGDGAPELTIGNGDRILVADGATGAIRASSPDLGSWIAASWCEPYDLDGAGGKELVCALGTPLADAGTGHRVYALRHAAGPDRLELMWSTNVGERDEDLGLSTEPVSDLDGDGQPEVVVSGSLADGSPVTAVIDARTGAVLATLAGEVVVGPAGVEPAERVLLTRAEDQLSAWVFTRGADAPLQRRWLNKYRRVVVTRAWDVAARRPLSGRVAVHDVDGDGARDVLAVNTETTWEVIAHALTSATGAAVRTWRGPADSDVLAAWRWVDDELVLSTTDGSLTALDATLTAPLGGVSAGGYYDAGGWLHLPFAPITGDVDGDGDDELLVTDSRRALRVLEPRDAGRAVPPRPRWERGRSTGPALVPGLGATGTGVVCRTTVPSAVPARELLTALDGNGGVLWETAIGDVVFNDVLVAGLDGDAVPDLIVQWGHAADTAVQTTAFAGSSGLALWSHETAAGPTRFPSGAAIADWDGDGVDDVVFHHYGVRVLSGVDGDEIATSGPSTQHYFLPTLTDVDGDGALDVSLSGGFYPSRTLAHDLSEVVWASTDDDRPYPYAAAVSCPAGPVLVGGSLLHPSRLKVTHQGGASPGAWQSVVLAGGEVFPDDDAAASAGRVGGQLTSVHAHADLTGQGRPSVVVGSSDGWLYALDPCTLTLDFARDFGAPVGAVAFLDANGDDVDEMVVSVADGFLYGLQHGALAAPAGVADIDPAGAPQVDVDELETSGAVGAAWAPVPGATGYEVAVVIEGESYLTAPPWVPVASTTITLDGLAFEDGRRYAIAVRAVGEGGRSPDAVSDGFIVRVVGSPAAPDGGPGDAGGAPVDGAAGGCCEAGRQSPQTAALAAAVVVLLLARRRRLRTPRGRQP